MATYYCDITADFVAGRDGTNNGAEVLTGLGGLQIAVRGGGGAGGEFKAGGLVASDEIHLKGGTGMVSRLVKLECDTADVSAWEIGDTVRNDAGDGDHWTGKIVQERDNVATGLSSDQICLVQIDAPADYDDVNDNLADGVENTTKAETDDLLSVVCEGLEIDTNDGTAADHIHVIGCDASWAVRAGQAVLDGDGDATQCMLINDIDRWKIENVTFTGAAGDGVTSAGPLFYYWTFRQCIFHTNGAHGIDLNNDGTRLRFIQCIAYSNTSAGYYYSATAANIHFVFSVAKNNGAQGFTLMDGCQWYGCLSFGNDDDNYYPYGDNNLLANCVASDSDDGGGTAGSGIRLRTGMQNATIIGCRCTDNDAYGIEADDADESYLEDWNVFYNNTTADLGNIDCGLNSYGDSSGGGTHPLGAPADNGFEAGEYNVADGKEIDSLAINLEWD